MQQIWRQPAVGLTIGLFIDLKMTVDKLVLKVDVALVVVSVYYN